MARIRTLSRVRKPLRNVKIALEELESRLVPSVNVLSYGYGNTESTDVNAGETQLTPANVNSSDFGRLYKVGTDGPVRGQPLVEQNVVIAALGGDSAVNIVGPTGTHNVVFVGTENASEYAIDTTTGTILWHRSFLSVSPTNTGSTPGTNIDNILGATSLSPKSPGGILATSVIDPISGTMYVMVATVESIGGVTHYVHVMHGISTSDGTDKVQPFLVGDTSASGNNTPMFVYGTGDGAITDPNAATDGNPGTTIVNFNAQVDHDRSALSLVNGKLYAAFCSPGDIFPYHGWIIAWNVSPSGFTLAGWFCDCPNNGLSGIWMGGGTLQFEPDGSAFYFETGNGSGGNPTLNAQGLPSNANYNEALVKMVADPSTSINHQGVNGWGMKVVDFFIPYNVNALDVADADFGSGSPLLLPPSAGIPGHPNLILSSGKSGEIYLSDRNSLGKFDPVNDNVLNAVNDGSGHIEPPNLISGSLSTGAYFNGKVYWVSGYTGDAYAYQISSTGIVAAVSQTANQMGFEPGSIQISSNGAVNGIVWVMDRSLNAIHAFDASSFSTELWNSNQKAGDALDSALTFQAPTVADGQVFVGTSDSLTVYGLNQAATAAPAAPTLTATPLTGSSINLTWTDSSTYPNTAASYSIEESTDGTTYSYVTTAPAGASSIAIGGLMPATGYWFRIRGQDAVGYSPYSNIAMATTTTQVPGLDFSGGFGTAAIQNQFTMNGSAHFNGSSLELTTSGNANQTGSAFVTSPVDVTSFQTQFTFRTTNSSTSAEGFTFTIQNANPTALGGSGAALGYGPQVGGGSPGINNSVAVKFDLNNNNGEGADSTGLYIDGAAPTSSGSIDLSATGINFHDGDVFRVNLNYNGTTLTVTITDTTTNAAITENYPISIVNTLGSTTGYVGFTGSTGTQTATQDILTWTYTPTAAFSPNAPSGLGAVPATANSVLLTWTTNSANQTSFNLDRATDSGFTQNLMTENLPATPSSFTDTAAGLAPGGTYYYRLRAFNSAGNSGNSNVASVTIPLPPPAATNLQVSAVSSSEIDLQWTDNAGHNTQGYHVYRATNHGSLTLIANLPPTSRTAPDPYGFSDTSVSPGIFYEYQIVCYNTSGNNGLADISVTTLTTPPNLVEVQQSGTTATLYFSAPAGATSFNVYRGTASGAETLLKSGVSGSPYTDSTLTSGTTYYYYVTAVNANAAPLPNESQPSDEISPKTSAGTFQWSGGGADNNWTTPANWMGGAVPTGDGNETLLFPSSGASQLASVDNLPAGANAFAGITFAGAGYALTLNNPMAIGSAGIQEQSGGMNTITGSATVGLFLVANETFTTASGATLNVSAPIDNGGLTLTIGGSGNSNLNGALSDSGGLTVSGTTTLALEAANSYTGATVINSGTTVNAQNGGALGVNSAVLNNGTVNAQPAAGLNATYYNTAGATDPQDAVGIPANATAASLLSYVATLPVLATDNSATSPQPGSSNWNQNGLYFDYGEDGNGATSGFPAALQSSNMGTSFMGVWSGQFYAPVAGVYDFGTASDDGSAIYVDGALVVDNNMYQGMTFRDSNNPLDAGVTTAPTLSVGVHNIVIAYYQGAGGYGLYATVAGPAGSGYVGRLQNAALSSAFFSALQIGSLVGNGTFNLGPTPLTVGGNNASTVFAGNIKGFGNLTKVGTGALTLSAAEAFAGTWTINGGQLGLGTSATPISGENMAAIVNNTSNSVVLNNPSGNTFTLNAAVSGAAGLTLTGTGTYLLGGVSTFTGAVSIPAGAVVTASSSSALGAGSVTLPTGSTLNVSANSFGGGLPVTWYNWAGAADPVTGVGGNPPSATTTALLNYVAGLPIINDGIVGETSATPNAANSGGSLLEYGNHGTLSNGFPTVLTTLPAPNSGPNSFVGIFQGLFFAPVAGVYNFGTGSDDSSNLYIDGKLVVDNNHVQGYTVRYSNSPYDANATTPPTLTAGVHTILVEYSENGGGYAFDAFVNGPVGSGISGVMSNALLGVSVGKLAVGALSGGGTVNVGGNTLIVGGNNHPTLFSGAINATATANGAPNLIKTGTATLTLNNPAKLNVTGSMYVQSGTLQIGDGTTALGSTLALPAVLDNGTLALDGPSSSNLTYNGTISGSGGLTQIGAWTLNLGGNNSYTGPTVIPTGATVNASSNTALGNGDLNLPAGATLNVLAAGSANLGSGLPGKYYSISGDTLPDARMTTVAGINAMIAQYGASGAIATDTSAFTTANTQGQTNTNSNGATFNYGTGSTASTATAGFPTVVKTTNSGGNSIFGVWTGIFFAPFPGTYGFDAASDDGTTLFIDGTLVVNNNFQQGVTTRQGTINLAAGAHTIEMAFENGGGGYGLWADVQLPGQAFQRLPSSLLGTAAPTLLQIGALSGSGTINLASGASAPNNGLSVGTDNHSTTFTGTINSPGTTVANFPNLVKGGTGTFVLTGGESYTGTTGIAGGVLQLGTAASPISTLPTSGVFDNGTLMLFLPNNSTFTYNNVISGTGGVTFQGTGDTINLGGVNTYSGPTLVGANKIVQTVNNALPPATAITLGAGSQSGQIELNGHAGAIGSVTAVGTGTGNVLTNSSGVPVALTLADNGAPVNVNVAITGNLSLVVAGPGTQTFTAANTYNGSTSISAGTFIAAGSAALPGGGALSVSGSGVLDLAGHSVSVASLGGIGSTNLITNSSATPATLTITGTSGGPFAYNGLITGAVSLMDAGGANVVTNLDGSFSTFSGGVTVNSGTLGGVRGGFGIGPVTLYGGTVDLLTGQTVYPNNFQASAGSTSGLTVNATPTANAYAIGGSFSVAGGATVNVAADLASTPNQPYSLTLSGSTVLSGNLNLAGNGAAAASLIVGGALSGAGTSIGAVGGSGNVTLVAGSTYNVVLGGSGTGLFDSLALGGTATLAGGTLSVSYANNFSPAPGQSFTILQSAGALSGTFAQGGTITSGNATYSITYNAQSVVLTVTAVQPATTLLLTVPASASAGIPVNATLIAEDAGGNVAGGFTGAITLASSAGADIMPTSVMLINGTATVPVTLTGIGMQTLTATYTGLTTGSATITVSPGPLSKFLVTPLVAGGSTTAGSLFPIVVQAEDSYGNPISSGYSGPAQVTLSVSPSGTAGDFPLTVTLSSQGLGIGAGYLNTAGSYTLSASGGAYTGSAALTVTPAAAVKLAFAAQPANTVTGNVLAPVSVQVQDAYGNVITTDNTDVVTLGIASGPGTFTAGSTTSAAVHNGVATFTNLTLTVPGSYTLSEIVPATLIGPNSSSFTVAPLQVLSGSFQSTPSGFSVGFNAPFLVNSVTPALYGSGFGAGASVSPTVTLTQISGTPPSGSTLPFPVPGSVVVNSATNSLTFVETDTASVVNSGTPLLPDGTYQVRISSSGVNGLQALNAGGGFLDGTNAGTPGHDFTTTITVSAAGTDVVWMPATADGPGQALSAPGMNQAGVGYPIYLNDSTAKVTSVQLTLNYNPALLSVTGVSGTGFTLLGSSTPGQALLRYSGPALPAGTQQPLGFVLATVPGGTAANPTPYKAKDLLHLSGVSLNGGSIAAVAADALHLVAYVGDANGDGAYSSDDAVKITRAALQTDTGFTAYPLVDPVIVADTDGAGFLPADAALQVNEAGVGFPTSNLPNPPIPPGVHFQAIANNVDPTLSLHGGIQPTADGTIVVPINLDDAHPEGSTGLIRGHLALTYDPRLFTVTAADVHAGSLLAGGDWQVTPTIDQATGQIGIALSGDTAISSTVSGSLVTIDFHPIVGRISNPSTIALVPSTSPNGQLVATELEDSQGAFTLTLSPANGSSVGDAGFVDRTGTAPATRVFDAPASAAAVTPTEQIDGPAVASVETTDLTPAAVPDALAAAEPAALSPSPLVLQLSAATPHLVAPVVPTPFTAGVVFQLTNTPMVNVAASLGAMAWQHLADQLFQVLTRTDVGLTGPGRDTPGHVLAGQLLLAQPAAGDFDGFDWDSVGSLLDRQGVAAWSAARPARREQPPNLPSSATPAATERAALDELFAQVADDTDLLGEDE